MSIGADDSLHIAGYDSGVAGLIYVYMTGYADSTPELVEVDTNKSVGLWTDVILADPGTPYIAYYNNSENGTRESIRLAVAQHDVSTGVQAGVDGDGKVTGQWEFATVPSGTVPQGGVPEFNGLGIGLRTSDGQPVIGYLGNGLESTVRLGE
jgi:hypothetical protein